MSESEARVAVIGFGGSHHHDNDVGAAVAHELRKQTPSRISILEQTGEPLELGNAMEGFDLVILVDSSCTGAQPGTVLRLDASERPGYVDWFPHYSTHSAGLPDSLQQNRMLGTMPARVLLFCVEGTDYSDGDGLSAEVRASVGKVVELLLEELNLC